MKKTLAVLLCLAMLFTALSVNVFAADTPLVEINTSASANFEKTSFIIEFNGFDSKLAGYDLKVNVEGLKITGAEATNVEIIGNEKSYKISDDGKTLHIIEVVDDKTAASSITVYADILQQNGVSASISFADCKFADDSISLINNVTKSSAGTIEIFGEAVPTVSYVTTYAKKDTPISQPTNGYFYPYGSVMQGGTKLEKSTTDGSFKTTADGEYTHKQFAIPEGDFGTYGIAKDETGNTLIFGNYISVSTGTIENKTYGTMLIRGDWDGFKGNADSTAMVKALYQKVVEKSGGQDKTEVVLRRNSCLIGVTLVKRSDGKSLWTNDEKTTMEYGIKVQGIFEDYQYLTAAYSIDGTTTTLAKLVGLTKGE